DVYRPAVRITAVVQRIHTDKDVLSFQNLGPGQRKREKDCVSGRHIRRRYAGSHVAGASFFGDFDVIGEGGSANRSHIDFKDEMLFRAKRFGNFRGALELDRMPLTIVKAES